MKLKDIPVKFRKIRFVTMKESSSPNTVVFSPKTRRPKWITVEIRSMKLLNLAKVGMKNVLLPIERRPFAEYRIVTEKERNKLIKKGYKVEVIREVSNAAGIQFVIGGENIKTGISGLGRQTIVDKIGRKPGTTRKGGGGTRASAGGGGGGGAAGMGGDGFDGFGGGGGDDNVVITNSSDRRFLVFILKGNKRQQDMLEMQLMAIKEQNLQIEKRLRQLSVSQEETPVKKKLFHCNIQEDEMAHALWEVYSYYDKESKFTTEFQPIDLMAYLFVMLAVYGYGRDDFRQNAKQPFFDFFIKKVAPELEGMKRINRKTMGNRINDELAFLFEQQAPERPMSINERINRKKKENQFVEICDFFHKKTKYGLSLKKIDWKR